MPRTRNAPRGLATALTTATTLLLAGGSAWAQSTPSPWSNDPSPAATSPAPAQPVVEPPPQVLPTIVASGYPEPPPPAPMPDERFQRPGTVPLVIQHEGTPLEVQRIVGTHIEDVPVTTRWGTSVQSVERQDNQFVCMTPCTLFLAPGGQTYHFEGEGMMGANITLPISPTGQRVVLTGASVMRPLGGFMLAFFGVPLGLFGTVLLGFAAGGSGGTPDATSTMVAIGGVTAVLGGGMATLGIYLMATGRTRVVRSEALPGARAQAPRFLGAAIAPDATGHGALATAAFAF